MPKQQKTEDEEVLSLQDLCVGPLYAPYALTEENLQVVFKALFGLAKIDMYCVECKRASIFFAFENEEPPCDASELKHFSDSVVRELYCSRKDRHRASFIFRLESGTLKKIGQWPSLADLSESEFKSYRAVLSTDDYKELARAAGLASHGVGIGSFVYLRRIFERLINEARDEAALSPNWDESSFRRARMDEKIALLQAHLPPFVFEKRRLYSILSKGIHDLSETECLTYFPVVRSGIELILDEKVAAKEKKKKLDAARKQIEDIGNKISSP